MNYNLEKTLLPALLVKATISLLPQMDSCLPAHFLCCDLWNFTLRVCYFTCMFTTRENKVFELLESEVSVALNAADLAVVASNNVVEKERK